MGGVTPEGGDVSQGASAVGRDLGSVARLSDTGLVVAVARGHDEALAEVYRRHATSVYGLARRLCGPDSGADVTQEVFLALWRAPERFDPQRGSLRSFLLTQAHGRSIDRTRAEAARRKREATASEAERRAVAEHDVEREALAQLASKEVWGLLSDLPDATIRAIALAFFAGYTYRQVADRLHQPEGTVKTRIRTGLAQLRARMGDHDRFSSPSNHSNLSTSP